MDSQSFTCKTCGKCFSLYQYLRVHIKTHTVERNYKCNCGKSFTSKSSLNRHALVHIEDKPHGCKFCDKYFRHPEALEIHTKRHTGDRERSYECAICGNKFYKNSDLKQHSLIHKSEKCHECMICGRSFIKRGLLTQHEKIHKGIVCKNCGETFNNIDSLKRHIRTHTEVKVHKCPTCEKSFCSKSNLKRHEMTHMREKVTTIAL